MRNTSEYFAPVVVGTLLFIAPFVVAGQDLPAAKLSLDYRPPTQMLSAELGEFLARRLHVELERGEIEKLAVRLRIEVRSREKVSAYPRYDSETIELQAGKAYPGAAFFHDLDPARLAPEFRERREITLGPSVSQYPPQQGAIPRECDEASHSLQVELLAEGTQFAMPKPVFDVCLNMKP